jgi:phospholipase/lecithinase/hemolysin
MDGTRSSVLGTVARLVLAVALGSIAACVTPPQTTRVISFGDSLSDLGTYAERTEGKTPGRFTTNPGPIWVEVVAAGLGTSISEYRHAGWGKPEKVLGGFGYAEGGSRVAEQPGSFNTDASGGPGSSQTTMPIREQVSLHLRRDRFTSQDVVLFWGGPNDLFRHAMFAPAPTAEAGEALVRASAQGLAREARRVVESGRATVVVLTIDDYGEVPGVRNTPNRDKLSNWSTAFNDELRSHLNGSPTVLVDAGQLLRDARNDPSRFSLKNSLTPACNMPSLPFRSVLFCTDQTLVQPGADKEYLYADGVHLTAAGHKLVANAVLRALKR